MEHDLMEAVSKYTKLFNFKHRHVEVAVNQCWSLMALSRLEVYRDVVFTHNCTKEDIIYNKKDPESTCPIGVTFRGSTLMVTFGTYTLCGQADTLLKVFLNTPEVCPICEDNTNVCMTTLCC